MDLVGIFGAIATVLVFIALVGALAWAYSRRRRPDDARDAGAQRERSGESTGRGDGASKR